MAERLNPAELEQQLVTFKWDPAKDWYEWNIKDSIRQIAAGADSIVFPLGKDNVVKVYKDGIKFLPQLELYMDVTNRGSKLLETEKHSIEHSLWLLGRKFRVLINPIMGIYVFENSKTLCAVSKYISGKKLSSVSPDAPDMLWPLSHQLNEELDVKGISLSRGNVKVVSVFISPTLMVTDLCDSIGDLRRR